MMAAVLRKYIFTLRKFYEWLPYIQRFAGVLLILVGIMVWLNWVEKGLGILTSFF
jgi:cytochrome c-type biogenesis protein